MSQLNASAQLGLSAVSQGGTFCLLELGGPPGVTVEVVPPRGMLSTNSGEGCHLLSLGDCLDAGAKGSGRSLFSHSGGSL